MGGTKYQLFLARPLLLEPRRLRPSFLVTQLSQRSKLQGKQANLLVPVDRRRPTTGQEELLQANGGPWLAGHRRNRPRHFGHRTWSMNNLCIRDYLAVFGNYHRFEKTSVLGQALVSVASSPRGSSDSPPVHGFHQPCLFPRLPVSSMASHQPCLFPCPPVSSMASPALSPCQSVAAPCLHPLIPARCSQTSGIDALYLL